MIPWKKLHEASSLYGLCDIFVWGIQAGSFLAVEGFHSVMIRTGENAQRSHSGEMRNQIIVINNSPTVVFKVDRVAEKTVVTNPRHAKRVQDDVLTRSLVVISKRTKHANETIVAP